MATDQLDLAILDRVRVNARASVKEMADALGVSPATVSKRLKRLEERGIIKGYVTIFDEAKLGYGCRIMLLITTNGSVDSGYIAKKIAKMQESCISLQAAGSYDIVAVLNCLTQEDASNMIESIKKLGGVERVEPLFITNRYKLLNKILFNVEEEAKNLAVEKI